MEYPQQIQELLKKYWSIETTVEEERELRNYFLLHRDTADAQSLYFLFLERESDVEMPAEIRPVAEAKTAKLRPIWKQIVSIAAAVSIVLLALIGLREYNSTNAMYASGEQLEVDEAYTEAKEALLFVSQKLNSSQSSASKQLNKVSLYTTILK